jgi:hypothetical protein
MKKKERSKTMTNKTIASFLGGTPLKEPEVFAPLVSPNHVGIELELEGCGQMPPINKYWANKGDGSLRIEGVEYYFSKPLAGEDVWNAIKLMHKACAVGNPNPSEYCSTHVHIDFLNNTVKECCMFLFTHMLFEDALAQYWGPNRADNLFCLTSSNAEQSGNIISRMYHLDDIRFLRDVGEQNVKYSAMNFYPLIRFGTIESRIAGPITHMDKMLAWVNTLLAIKKFSLTLKTPDDLLRVCSQLGTNGLFREVLGDALYSEYAEFIDDSNIYEAIDRIQFILYNKP